MTTECDPILGTCTQVPLDCDDGNPCTLDLCAAVDGNASCSHQNVTSGTVCDDGIDCSTGTMCSAAGTCGGGGWLQTPECACPPAETPTVLAAAAGTNVINLSWNAGTGTGAGAVQYKILRGTNAGGPFTQIGVTTGNTYTVNGLTCGTTYFFVVQAVSVCGSLSPSTPVAASTLACP
jgi:hypothetical protein